MEYVLIVRARRCLMSGSYSNYLNIYDKDSKIEITLQADKSAFRSKRSSAQKILGGSKKPSSIKKEDINPDTIDYNKKILHASWHPQEYSIAVAATNNLFLFSTL